ncbi:MAG: transcriptional regulator [Acidilobaceae archaeon]
MVSDKAIGITLVAVSLVVILLYAWLLFLPPDVRVLGRELSGEEVSMLVIKATVMAGVLVVFGLVAWIGYTLATTPPPKPIEEIEREIEDELRKLGSSRGSERELK